ncbi:MAG: 3-hydroxyacyl-CoA dehydrogenase [Rhodospirillales bacterium]
MSGHIAIVGAGLVGSGWAIVFARAGLTVRAFDRSQEIREGLLAEVQGSLEDLESHGLIESARSVLNRISVAETLADAIEGARYVQESVLERQDVKQAVCAELDELLGDETIVGSSTSGIPASAFTEDLAKRERFVVAHPVNPPYLAPVVEIVPAPWTAPETVESTVALMEQVGQVPVRLTREVEGFVLNRLQSALLREAWALYEEGYASAADIDKTVSEGLGLRWSFMGPFETIDLNAPGGVSDYAHRLGALYHAIARSRPDPQPWGEALIDRVTEERRGAVALGDLPARRAWRDQRLMALAAHKAAIKSGGS